MDAPSPFAAHLFCHRHEVLDAERLAALRKAPVLWRGQPLPAAQLKHVDDQTFAALITVLAAIQTAGLEEFDFSAWGVIGAPRFIGRAGLEPHIRRFMAEGPWSVTPHAIPHRCLHSPSGLISQLLGWHGANIGAGGGRNGAGEALLAALACLTPETAGLWLVLSAYDPERLPDNVPAAPAWQLHVLALALTPTPMPTTIGCFAVVPHPQVGASLEAPDLLQQLAAAFSTPDATPRTWRAGADLGVRWSSRVNTRHDPPHDDTARAGRLARSKETAS
jgi:hypothetical protein